MRKNRIILIIVCVIIFLSGTVMSLVTYFRPHGQTVRITQDGELIYTVDLQSSEDRIIETEYKGSRNIIKIKDHRICVSDADCPDRTCVKTGFLKSAASPVVCLPNKLVISFAEDN